MLSPYVAESWICGPLGDPSSGPSLVPFGPMFWLLCCRVLVGRHRNNDPGCADIA